MFVKPDTPIKLIQCDCCDMFFYRRINTIVGDQKIFYNREHKHRYYKTGEERNDMTLKDLRQPKYTIPGVSVIHSSLWTRPFKLAKELVDVA